MTYLVPLDPLSTLWLEQGVLETIDISEFDVDDFITISLPAFPLSIITLDESFIEFTSEPHGNFFVGPTDTVTFDQSETTLVEGNSEFRFRKELLSTIDDSAITGVRFEIVATGTGDFRVMSIRCIDKDWVLAPLDIDTRNESLVRPVSLNGAYPGTVSADLNPWPNVFRSEQLPGAADPRPIDVSVIASFNTGASDFENVLSLFAREFSQDLVTMLELDGDLVGTLDGLPQPNYGQATYIPQTQFDIDAIEDTTPGVDVELDAIIGEGLTQGELNGRSQFDLERKPDALTASWIEVRLTWEGNDGKIEIFNAENVAPFYEFALTGTFDPLLNYVYALDLEERSLRIRIYERDNNLIGQELFDSTVMVDSEAFKRRKGRIGWNATLNDGDAFIEGVTARHTNFAEYRSVPFESITPVEGASIFASATPPTDLFKGINPGPWGGQIDNYPERGPEAFRIRNTTEGPLQGIQTNSVYLDNLGDTKISFDIYVVQEVLDQGSLEIFLWDGHTPIPIPARLTGNGWSHIEFDLAALYDDIVPEWYTLVIVQLLSNLPNDWLIDKISISRRNLSWAARPYLDDPWNENAKDWIPFKDTINTPSGVLFKERARKFQVHSKALQQTSKINSVRIEPKYAQLGRFAWVDEDVTLSPPTASFSSSVAALGVTLTSTATDPFGRIIAHLWSFGDGSEDAGTVVHHQYETAGTYPVTLTAVDTEGALTTTTTNVTV